jgi:phenylalanyl-tRNA synthetase alpha chain
MDLSEVNLLINEIKNIEIDGDESLQVFKKKYNDILKKKLYDLKNLDPEGKKEYGVFINKLKNAIDIKYKESVQKINSVKKIKTDFFDYSLPYVPFVGELHPLTVLRNKLFSIFKKLGFDIFIRRTN